MKNGRLILGLIVGAAAAYWWLKKQPATIPPVGTGPAPAPGITPASSVPRVINTQTGVTAMAGVCLPNV